MTERSKFSDIAVLSCWTLLGATSRRLWAPDVTHWHNREHVGKKSLYMYITQQDKYLTCIYGRYGAANIVLLLLYACESKTRLSLTPRHDMMLTACVVECLQGKQPHTYHTW